MEKNAKKANLNRKWIKLRLEKLTNDLVLSRSAKLQLSKWKQSGNIIERRNYSDSVSCNLLRPFLAKAPEWRSAESQL